MTQPLFGYAERPAPAQHGSATSEAAARRIDGSRGVIRRTILAALDQAGSDGLTVEQVTAAVSRLLGRPVKEATIVGRLCGRRPELGDAVVRTDRKRRNPASGSDAYIYVLRTHHPGHPWRAPAAADAPNQALQPGAGPTEPAATFRLLALERTAGRVAQILRAPLAEVAAIIGPHLAAIATADGLRAEYTRAVQLAHETSAARGGLEQWRAAAYPETAGGQEQTP